MWFAATCATKSEICRTLATIHMCSIDTFEYADPHALANHTQKHNSWVDGACTHTSKSLQAFKKCPPSLTRATNSQFQIFTHTHIHAHLHESAHVHTTNAHTHPRFQDDRERYFKSVETVFSVLNDKGRSLYGPEVPPIQLYSRTPTGSNFHVPFYTHHPQHKDAGYFINYHTWLAGQRECDHLHDGMGFITGHSAITNEFEINLQRVDPR